MGHGFEYAAYTILSEEYKKGSLKNAKSYNLLLWILMPLTLIITIHFIFVGIAPMVHIYTLDK